MTFSAGVGPRVGKQLTLLTVGVENIADRRRSNGIISEGVQFLLITLDHCESVAVLSGSLAEVIPDQYFIDQGIGVVDNGHAGYQFSSLRDGGSALDSHNDIATDGDVGGLVDPNTHDPNAVEHVAGQSYVPGVVYFNAVGLAVYE